MPKERVTPQRVRTCLRGVIDPELQINIVDLGLIYGIHVRANRIDIDMTLTNPASPMAGALAAEVEQAVRAAFEEIDDVEVSLVFDPPWTLGRLSKRAKKDLGYEG